MVMTATVLRVNAQSLLVRDEATGQQVLVNTSNTGRFSVGDRVVIFYTGPMTASIPPQITAVTVQTIGRPPLRPGVIFPIVPPIGTLPPVVRPGEMRGTVRHVGENFLLFRNAVTNQDLRVEYDYARHFCVGQNIIVSFDPRLNTNPNRIFASDINPVC